MTTMNESIMLSGDKDSQWLASDDFFDQYVNMDFFENNAADQQDANAAGIFSGSDEFASLFGSEEEGEEEETSEESGSKSTCTASPRLPSGDYSPSPPLPSRRTDALPSSLLHKAVIPGSGLATSLSSDDNSVTSQGLSSIIANDTDTLLASALDYKVDTAPLPALPGQRSASTHSKSDDSEKAEQMNQPNFARPGQRDFWAQRLEESAHQFDLPYQQASLSPPAFTTLSPAPPEQGVGSPSVLGHANRPDRHFPFGSVASPTPDSFPNQPQNTPMLSPNPEASLPQGYLQRQVNTASPDLPLSLATFSSDTIHSPHEQVSSQGTLWDRQSSTWPHIQQPSNLNYTYPQLDDSQVQPWWPPNIDSSQPYADYTMQQAYQTSRGPSQSTEASISDESHGVNPAAFQLDGLMIDCPTNTSFNASPDCGDHRTLYSATSSSLRMQKRQNSAPIRSTGSRLHAPDPRRHRSQPSRTPSPPESSRHSRHPLKGQTQHRRSKSGVSSHSGASEAIDSPQSASVGFVNFTPNDSKKILTGVAPSGSSKTKARREKEAADKRKRLSQAAARAVREAGGDVHALEREGLFA